MGLRCVTRLKLQTRFYDRSCRAVSSPYCKKVYEKLAMVLNIAFVLAGMQSYRLGQERHTHSRRLLFPESPPYFITGLALPLPTCQRRGAPQRAELTRTLTAQLDGMTETQLKAYTLFDWEIRSP